MEQLPDHRQPLNPAVGDKSSAQNLEDDPNVSRTQPRSAWWIMLSLLSVFCVLCTTTGVRCAVTDGCLQLNTSWACGNNLTCTAYHIPSLGSLLDNPGTGALAVSALNTMVALHLLMSLNLCILVRNYSKLAVVCLMATLVALYVTLYISFIVGAWYVSVAPISFLGLWCLSAVYGLGHYYRRQASKPLFWVSLGATACFVLASLLYIAFSPIPIQMFANRDIGILAAQLFMAVSCVVFVISVALHTRSVAYLAQVQRGYSSLATSGNGYTTMSL